ncbi:MAG: SLC13 family permease [Enterocloster clostridioformis]
MIFAVAILGWILEIKLDLKSSGSNYFGDCIVLPGIEVIDWKTGITNISWNSIFLISAGVLIGDVLYSSGLAEKMANIFFVPSLLENGILIRDIYIVISVSILKILFSSNTVSGVVLVPIMLSVAAANSLSPWGLVAPCIFHQHCPSLWFHPAQ